MTTEARLRTLRLAVSLLVAATAIADGCSLLFENVAGFAPPFWQPLKTLGPLNATELGVFNPLRVWGLLLVVLGAVAALSLLLPWTAARVVPLLLLAGAFARYGVGGLIAGAGPMAATLGGSNGLALCALAVLGALLHAGHHGSDPTRRRTDAPAR